MTARNNLRTAKATLIMVNQDLKNTIAKRTLLENYLKTLLDLAKRTEDLHVTLGAAHAQAGIAPFDTTPNFAVAIQRLKAIQHNINAGLATIAAERDQLAEVRATTEAALAAERADLESTTEAGGKAIGAVCAAAKVNGGKLFNTARESTKNLCELINALADGACSLEEHDASLSQPMEEGVNSVITTMIDAQKGFFANAAQLRLADDLFFI